MEAGAQIDRTSKQGMTPLCMAVAGGHTEVVKLLLDSNADPNMTGPLAGSGDPGKYALVSCQKGEIITSLLLTLSFTTRESFTPELNDRKLNEKLN